MKRQLCPGHPDSWPIPPTHAPAIYTNARNSHLLLRRSMLLQGFQGRGGVKNELFLYKL
jgi:hypothetical protein